MGQWPSAGQADFLQMKTRKLGCRCWVKLFVKDFVCRNLTDGGSKYGPPIPFLIDIFPSYDLAYYAIRGSP